MSRAFKLFINVPITHAHQLREALAKAGAGQIGHYHSCSFSVRGIGRFMPTDKATPHIGKADKLQEVEEEQVQVSVSQQRLESVLKAMREAHPYEQIGYDVFQKYVP